MQQNCDYHSTRFVSELKTDQYNEDLDNVVLCGDYRYTIVY